MWNVMGMFGDASVHWKYKQRQKKKKKDSQGICQSDLQFTSGNNLAEGEERRVVQTETFMVSSCTFSAAWGKSSAEHCQFREGPFCISHFRIRKVLLSNSKLAKNIAGGRRHVSPDKQQVLNGKCITRHFLFCQGRHKGQKIDINLCFLRQQIRI